MHIIRKIQYIIDLLENKILSSMYHIYSNYSHSLQNQVFLNSRMIPCIHKQHEQQHKWMLPTFSECARRKTISRPTFASFIINSHLLATITQHARIARILNALTSLPPPRRVNNSTSTRPLYKSSSACLPCMRSARVAVERREESTSGRGAFHCRTAWHR